MPRQDAQGRWVSDDGRHWWDGSTWRPAPQATPAKADRAGADIPYLIGTGCALALLVLVLMAFCTTIVAQSPSFQTTPTP